MFFVHSRNKMTTTGCTYPESQPEQEDCRRSTTVSEFLDWENSETVSRGLKPLLQNNKISCMNSLKPTVPPKPPHGPPLYREPPNPSSPPPPVAHCAYRSQPDVCNLTPSKLSLPCDRYTDTTESTCVPPDDPFNSQHGAEGNNIVAGDARPVFVGTQAWVHEHKTHGNMVGERLSSLQRKLRSLLTQTQQKTGDLHSGDSLKHPQCIVECSSLTSIEERNDQKRCNQMQNSAASMSNDQNLSYICTSSVGNNHVTQTSVPVIYSGTFQSTERHPFESELEDSRDTTHIRDTCTKLFSRDTQCSSYINQRSNCYTNNIKSSFDYDKLVPKEVIGRPCQEKRLLDASSNIDSCEKSAQNSGVLITADKQHSASKPLISLEPETIYYSMKALCYIQDSCEEPCKNATVPAQKVANSPKQCLDSNDTAVVGVDCGDTSDQYKSSSESGHGTMHSCSARDNKSLASAYSSRISALSHLDTSLDSDHSANYSLWDNSHHSEWTEKSSSTRKPREYEISQSANNDEQHSKPLQIETMGHNSCTESPSTTPPFPERSPPPLSPVGGKSLPQTPSKGKYKLAQNVTSNTRSSKALELEPDDSDVGKLKDESSSLFPKSTAGRKNIVRKSTSSAPITCRHWNGKGKNFRNNSSISHRTGYNCRKSRTSPFSKHPTLSLAVPSYADYADPEWTSTTTGLDGESLIDDQDDLSSDLSMSTSTMDPLELSMIRKQLEGLENMYSEILLLLGVKSNASRLSRNGGSNSDLRHSRCRISESMSSLTARNSSNHGNHTYADKRGIFEKRRGKDFKNGSANKRLQRLESHVVTLARSVAHLSSEMRTQHMLVQELEHMRRDVTWVHERLRLLQLAQGTPDTSGHLHGHKGIHMQKDWDFFRKEVNELLNPNRAKKLTKFFGDEPPLIRQFLKRLGYEKYASHFESEKIGIMELPYLTEERLQKIGVPMGPRIRIMQEAHAYCQQNQYKVYIV